MTFSYAQGSSLAGAAYDRWLEEPDEETEVFDDEDYQYELERDLPYDCE